jgi:hypothetical protein
LSASFFTTDTLFKVKQNYIDFDYPAVVGMA